MEPSWRVGNRIHLLPGAEYYVPALLDALDSAEKSVIVEQYLIYTGTFASRVISALCNAAHSGVGHGSESDGFLNTPALIKSLIFKFL